MAVKYDCKEFPMFMDKQSFPPDPYTWAKKQTFNYKRKQMQK